MATEEANHWVEKDAEERASHPRRSPDRRRSCERGSRLRAACWPPAAAEPAARSDGPSARSSAANPVRQQPVMIRTQYGAAIFIIIVAIPNIKTWAVQSQWPAIQPLQQTFVVQDPNLPRIKTFLRDQTGKPLYLFICRSDSDASGPSNVIYSGALDCRLIPAELGEIETNLLVESHRLAAWYSRGRMFFHELYGPCATYPEYGRVRNFHLRGLTFTMKFFDIEFEPLAKGRPTDDVTARSYKVRVSAKNNPSAMREIAEPSGYLDPTVKVRTPPRSCNVVQKGIEWNEK